MNIFRRWIDRCYNVDCTRSWPTCSSRFRRFCLSPQQIVPPNSSLKSVYIEKQYPLFLHTKFKNYVYILKMPSAKWVKTKQYSPSPFVVNINVTAKTWGLLVLVCDHWYRNFFFLIKIGSSPLKWLHLLWLILIIPFSIILLIMIKKRCKTPVNYSSVEMINFGFVAQDPIQEPILDQDTAVVV